MDIAVKTEQFKKVVSCASRATSNKAIQPILNNILLSSENGSLIVSATDLDMAIQCKLPASILEHGKVTLPAKKLDEIVNKAPGDDINISIDKNQLARIKSHRSKFQINGVSPEDFPDIIKSKDGVSVFNVKQEELLRAISLTSFATTKFETTSILSGANFTTRGSDFEIGATDGSRLARYIGALSKSNETGENSTQISAVIPGRALVELERLLTSFREGNDTVSFYLLPGQIIFQNNDFTLSTRLLGGTFPTYDKLIPQAQSNKAVFLRNELLSALERVAILANERTSVIKLSFGAKSKSVQISANSPDYGNALDEVDVEYSGSELEIAFNYRYLTEALHNLREEKIMLEFETSLSPILVSLCDKKDYSFTYLIMPVQLR